MYDCLSGVTADHEIKLTFSSFIVRAVHLPVRPLITNYPHHSLNNNIHRMLPASFFLLSSHTHSIIYRSSLFLFIDLKRFVKEMHAYVS